MIGHITDALIKESKAIPDFNVGTIILKTDYNHANIGSYTMPLLILDIMEGSDSGQVIGGLTRLEYDIGFNTYNYEPDPLGDDTTGYPPDLLNVIDVVRRHFTKGKNGAYILPNDLLYAGFNYMVLDGDITYNGEILPCGTNFTAIEGFANYTTTNGGYVVTGGWSTPDMWGLLNKYAFRFTLGGINPADALEGDGLSMGYRIVMQTVSYDLDTANIITSTSQVTSINQLNNPSY